MKKLMLGAAVLAMLAGTTASAQPYGGWRHGYRDSDRDGRPDRSEWNRDRDRDGRPDQYDRHDRRGGYGHHHHRYHLDGPGYGYSGYRGAWRVGQRYPHWRNDSYWVRDYWDYGLPEPRRGYRYYRTDEGDIVMVAIASGLIGLIAGQALSDDY
jgi:Ni/Co efflux regulator RcnB